MKKKTLSFGSILTLIVLLTVSTTSFAQITGIVKDDKGEVLIGVTVLQKGTTRGVVTDVNGNFNINVKSGTALEFSSIGYNNLEQPAAAEMIVVMSEGAQTIDDVVVIGYGGVQKAKTMTAGISNVKVDQLAKLPVTTLGEGLE